MNTPTIKRIVSWTFPYFGNIHIMPYGELEVTDGVDTKICKTKGDKYTDNEADLKVSLRSPPNLA